MDEKLRVKITSSQSTSSAIGEYLFPCISPWAVTRSTWFSIIERGSVAAIHIIRCSGLSSSRQLASATLGFFNLSHLHTQRCYVYNEACLSSLKSRGSTLSSRPHMPPSAPHATDKLGWSCYSIWKSLCLV